MGRMIMEGEVMNLTLPSPDMYQHDLYEIPVGDTGAIVHKCKIVYGDSWLYAWVYSHGDLDIIIQPKGKRRER